MITVVMHPLAVVLEVLAIILSIGTTVFVAFRRSEVKALRTTMETQAGSIAALETELATVTQAGERKDLELESMRKDISKLKSERDVKDSLIQLLVEAIAAAGVCVKAPWCPNRIRPATDLSLGVEEG